VKEEALLSWGRNGPMKSKGIHPELGEFTLLTDSVAASIRGSTDGIPHDSEPRPIFPELPTDGQHQRTMAFDVLRFKDRHLQSDKLDPKQLF